MARSVSCGISGRMRSVKGDKWRWLLGGKSLVGMNQGIFYFVCPLLGLAYDLDTVDFSEIYLF